MTIIPLKQRDLLTGRWCNVAAGREKEVTSLHIPLVAMLRWCVRPDVIWRHVPNGEHRDKRTAAKLKAMGVLPGSADLEFHWCDWDDERKRKRRRVLHLELKIANRPQSEAQAGFALAMKLLGDDYYVARSIDEAIGILGAHGLIKPDVEVCGKRWPQQANEYDGADDFARSIDECYRAIRERKAKGGPGWGGWE
jgi:hypothetical protein